MPASGAGMASELRFLQALLLGYFRLRVDIACGIAIAGIGGIDLASDGAASVHYGEAQATGR